MAKNVECGLDGFSMAIEQLLGDIPAGVQEKVGKAVEKSTRRGVKAVREQAEKGGLHKWSDEYVKGFGSHIERGAVTTGEIGNRAKPGLVHLLEKGHATLTGRRTNAYEHMGPAFDDIAEEFADQVADAVEEAIR